MLLLKSLEFYLPSKVIIGVDVVNRVGEISKEYADKVFLITNGKIMRKHNILGRIEGLLRKSDVEFIIYENLDRDPPTTTIDEMGELIRKSRVKLIVALGGTSVINAAKAASYMACNEGKVVQYINGEMGTDETIPIVIIPTIPGITQQVNDEFYLKDENDNIKKSFKNKGLFPVAILADPKLAATLPINYTIGSCFAILSNAIEGYISKESNPISDSLTLRVIEMIGGNLKQIFQQKEDLSALSNIMQAGVLLSMGLLTTHLGTCEACALALSSKDKMYKNIAHAIMLPHVMEFNLTATPNKYVNIAKALGGEVVKVTVVEAAIKAIEEIRKLLFDLKVPQKLSDYKVNKENLPVISSVARRYPFMNYAPLSVSKEDILNILLTSF